MHGKLPVLNEMLRDEKAKDQYSTYPTDSTSLLVESVLKQTTSIRGDFGTSGKCQPIPRDKMEEITKNTEVQPETWIGPATDSSRGRKSPDNTRTGEQVAPTGSTTTMAQSPSKAWTTVTLSSRGRKSPDKTKGLGLQFYQTETAEILYSKYEAKDPKYKKLRDMADEVWPRKILQLSLILLLLMSKDDAGREDISTEPTQWQPHHLMWYILIIIVSFLLAHPVKDSRRKIYPKAQQVGERDTEDHALLEIRGRSRNRTEREPRAKRSKRSIDRALRDFLRGNGGGRLGRDDQRKKRGREQTTKKPTRHRPSVTLRQRIGGSSFEHAERRKLATRIRWEIALVLKCNRDAASRHATQHELKGIWTTYLAHRGRPPDLSRNNNIQVTITLS